MSEAKFTPGPWLAEPSHASLDPVICMVAGLVISCKDTDFNKKANAHLIAAAPELYEACREASIMLKHLNVTGSLIDQVDSALAKARGETP